MRLGGGDEAILVRAQISLAEPPGNEKPAPPRPQGVTSSDSYTNLKA